MPAGDEDAPVTLPAPNQPVSFEHHIKSRNGSMPCDGSWPQEGVDAFERWVTSGMRQ